MHIYMEDILSNCHSKVHYLNLLFLMNAVQLCISICRGMVYLHSKKIIHRDLKPQNILVESLEEAKEKVCDFGLSAIKGKDEKTSEPEGTNTLMLFISFSNRNI